jgi:hypothetical protein
LLYGVSSIRPVNRPAIQPLKSTVKASAIRPSTEQSDDGVAR